MKRIASPANAATASIISVDPSRCRVWALHGRFAGAIDERSCREEIESIAAHGQLVPALGRRVADDPGCDYELICGARRLFAARHLGRSLLLELRELSDREALVAMDVENRQRHDLSPYERGVGYRAWLQQGVFASQEELARVFDLSTSQISRSLRLARLPAVIVDAFRDPRQIRECWGLAILDALDDPQRRTTLIRAARRLGSLSPRLQANEVMATLLSGPGRGRRSSHGRRDRVVPDQNGSPLFRVRHHSQSISLVFSAGKLSRYHLERIESRLTNILLATEGPPERQQLSAPEALQSRRGSVRHNPGATP